MHYINTKTLECPLTEFDIKKMNTHVSFPIPFSPPEGYEPIVVKDAPSYDKLTHKIVYGQPTKKKDKWSLGWDVIELTTDESASEMNRFISDCEMIIKAKLDEFARERGYDSILSACTYATSKVSRFKVEGQKAVNIRDQVWDAFYKAIESGQFSTYEEIEKQLPLMAW